MYNQSISQGRLHTLTDVLQCAETPDNGKPNTKHFVYSSAWGHQKNNRYLNHNPGNEEQTGFQYIVSIYFVCTIQ